MAKIITIDVPERLSVDEFFALVAETCEYRATPFTKYDCTKVYVSSEIGAMLYAYTEDHTCKNGYPGMSEKLDVNEVSLEDGWVSEDFTDVASAVQELLNADIDETILEDVVRVFIKEINDDDESWDKKARQLLRSFVQAPDAVNDFCISLCGWTFETLLKKSGLIPDFDNYCEEPYSGDNPKYEDGVC